MKSWLQRREPAEAEMLQPLFDKYVSHMLEYIRINLHPVMYNEQVGHGAAQGAWLPFPLLGLADADANGKVMLVNLKHGLGTH